MRHRKAGRRLGMATDRRIALMRSLSAALLRHEAIKTTEPRAKELRRFVERLITVSKRGDVAARRLAMKRLPDRLLVEKLFDVYGPRYQTRDGGYTRIIKLGPRRGDSAPMVRIELVDREEVAAI